MQSRFAVLVVVMSCSAFAVQPQTAQSCAEITKIKIDDVEIAKAVPVAAGTIAPAPYPGAPGIGSLPAHCHVDGVIHRRKGLGDEEYGIGFSLALPEREAWNGDFMMQGGGGSNGVVGYPLGASYSGDKPALVRGFVVASTDTGHKSKSGGFDFSFMHD